MASTADLLVSVRGAQSRRTPGDSQFDELKNRLKPVCHRTLRRQVLEYIRYTNRIPITHSFGSKLVFE
jgi:hypothetical protein